MRFTKSQYKRWSDLSRDMRSRITSRQNELNLYSILSWSIISTLQNLEITNKTKLYINEDGLHRRDGPALQFNHGVARQYWTFGEIHNVNGPAFCIKKNGPQQDIDIYYIHGFYLGHNIFLEITSDKNPLKIASQIIMFASRFRSQNPETYRRIIEHIEKTLRYQNVPTEAINTIVSMAELL